MLLFRISRSGARGPAAGDSGWAAKSTNTSWVHLVFDIVTIHHFSNLSPNLALLVQAAMVLKNGNRQGTKGAKEDTLRLGSIFFCRLPR